MKIIISILSLIIVALLGSTVAFVFMPGEPNNAQVSCEANGGTFVADSKECEWVSESVCTEMGGNFNACASACRNDPGPEICTRECVVVCDLN